MPVNSTSNTTAKTTGLSQREKKAVVYLRRQKVPAAVVAAAFGITANSVAAHVASDTIATRNAAASR